MSEPVQEQPKLRSWARNKIPAPSVTTTEDKKIEDKNGIENTENAQTETPPEANEKPLMRGWASRRNSGPMSLNDIANKYKSLALQQQERAVTATPSSPIQNSNTEESDSESESDSDSEEEDDDSQGLDDVIIKEVNVTEIKNEQIQFRSWTNRARTNTMTSSHAQHLIDITTKQYQATSNSADSLSTNSSSSRAERSNSIPVLPNSSLRQKLIEEAKKREESRIRKTRLKRKNYKMRQKIKADKSLSTISSFDKSDYENKINKLEQIEKEIINKVGQTRSFTLSDDRFFSIKLKVEDSPNHGEFLNEVDKLLNDETLISQILCFLDIPTIAICCLVCKKWYASVPRHSDRFLRLVESKIMQKIGDRFYLLDGIDEDIRTHRKEIYEGYIKSLVELYRMTKAMNGVELEVQKVDGVHTVELKYLVSLGKIFEGEEVGSVDRCQLWQDLVKGNWKKWEAKDGARHVLTGVEKSLEGVEIEVDVKVVEMTTKEFWFEVETQWEKNLLLKGEGNDEIMKQREKRIWTSAAMLFWEKLHQRVEKIYQAKIEWTTTGAEGKVVWEELVLGEMTFKEKEGSGTLVCWVGFVWGDRKEIT